MRRRFGTALGSLLVFLAGCTAGKTIVMQAPDAKLHFQSIDLVEGKSTVDIDDDVLKVLRRELEDDLIDRDAFKKGEELTLTYRVIQHESGSRAARMFALGFAGASELTVEAVFTDRGGNILATIQSDGVIKAGTFGGSSDGAIERAAEEISNYALSQFR